jgi:predicted ribosome quality control (RQC) complex YloA/Tae2 family protein
LPDSPLSVKEFPTFSDAVDNFYSQLDSQKVQQRSVQMENEAVKKLENVKRDHDKRLRALDDVQVKQQKRAELIEMNRELVEQCLTVVRWVN